MSLLEKCIENNARLGVTGLLLYKGGDFLQVLEGEERAVQKLYSTIEQDPRHRRCCELRWEIVRERRFPAWSMGFQNLDHTDILSKPGYSQFLNEPLASRGLEANPTRAEKLLSLFRDNH